MNFNNNGRPLSRKKTVRVLVALTILIWATQTLLSQWGLGAQLEEAPPHSLATDAMGEKFVPGTARFAAGATIEIRTEATIVGEEIKLKQIARWTENDARVLAPVGELVIARIGTGNPFRSISVYEMKQTLEEAGVNLAALKFVGANSCTVNRSDVEYDERVALQQWIEAQTEEVDASPTTTPAGDAVNIAGDSAGTSGEIVAETDSTLRSLLINDLAQRLALDPKMLQLSFKPQDEHLLNLAVPLFRFDIEPVRARNLGDVSWLVLIIAGQDVQKATIAANARAWQTQLVLNKPLGFRQIIGADDVTERRVLVDRLPDDPLLALNDAVGQQAARELKPGTILTARLVDAAQLVKPGQYVTITLKQGTVNIKTVAKALESGTAGQTIRVKNEATREVLQVVVTGQQAATMNLVSPTASSTLASTGNE